MYRFPISTVLLALAICSGAVAADQQDAKAGADCGGIAGIKCGAGLYCDFGDGQALKPSTCGHGDHMGKCAKIPEVCTQEFMPVCGCDGKGYSNACQAHAKGVTVAVPGKCFTPPNEPPPAEKK